ncbi:MAG: LLM class flavin-dependent oxidoreductase [Actinobacteria bacterium]|nr:LLM class flavin-dependent oxidoreductase [Actinomycetota bacterium]
MTKTIRLGQMVGCNLYRPPSLLAKITSSLDVISGGRLDWGIGAGWYENECRGYGYPFPVPKDRIAMLREAVEIVTSMWTKSETTYDGKYYQLSRANCDPKPLQHPRPPIWIGGGGDDEASIVKTWSPEILIRSTEAELRAGQALSIRGEPFEQWRDSNLVGTPDEVEAKIREYIALGCGGFVPWCVDYPTFDTLDAFGKIAASVRRDFPAQA